MRKSLWIISVIALFALIGCQKQEAAFQPDTFSDKDKCIVNLQNNKTLCYGDSRADVEAILQDGGDNGRPLVLYSSGVRVAYRDDIAVGFQLIEGSEGKYETARGARVGMSKAEVMELYGFKYAHEATPNNLDYAYDMKKGEFVDKTQVFSGDVQLKREQIFLVDAMFDGNKDGAASLIGLVDQKMAIFME
ncbi:hypothetical protein MU1_08860 [Paenibacillus glycanilyticus]|uniref:Lipoprotein n=2 Tax=Paenibacillus glycanilyticus TaxID=126569 RepID=A0ABQ6GA38_9BACL|nr:hypothetical protein MU1_08860 [Paenibacillus glycanilyticus]